MGNVQINEYNKQQQNKTFQTFRAVLNKCGRWGKLVIRIFLFPLKVKLNEFLQFINYSIRVY